MLDLFVVFFVLGIVVITTLSDQVVTVGSGKNIVSGSGNTLGSSNGDTHDIFECRGSDNAVYIDVVYDTQDSQKVSDSDRVYNCERVYDQTGKEVIREPTKAYQLNR